MKDFYAHETAVLDEGCRIGAGTKIWHFTHLMPEAVVGENCILGQNVMIANRATLGNNVKVQNNLSVYEGVTCEDEVFLGPSVVFTNVINPRAFIERNRSSDRLWCSAVPPSAQTPPSCVATLSANSHSWAQVRW